MYAYYRHIVQLSNLIISMVMLETFLSDFVAAVSNNNFQRVGGIHSSYAYSIMTVPSRIKCIGQCFQEQSCFTVSFMKRNRTCELSDRWIDEVGVSASKDLQWDIYIQTGRYCIFPSAHVLLYSPTKLFG